MAKGYSNPDIAARLVLSPETVKSHAHKIFEKLAVRARYELIVLAGSQRPPADPAS